MATKKKFTTLEYAEALNITPQAVVKKIHNENKKRELQKKSLATLTQKEKRVVIGDYFPKGVKIERNCREWIIYAPVDENGQILFDTEPAEIG